METPISEPLKVTLEISKEDYLSRLPSVDQANVQTIIGLFQETAEETQVKGSLLAVGGILTKPLPRPDIDLLVILQENSSGVGMQMYSDYYQLSLADFKIFADFVQKMLKKDQGKPFRITRTNEPAIDEEFDTPNILKHDGSIIISNKSGGVPLELIRSGSRSSYQSVISKGKRPFAVLTESS